MDIDTNISEVHPLAPFLPANARVLMSGSFPPPRSRWCMDFFYPNPQNDMWRIWGYIIYGDKNALLLPDGKKFDIDKVVSLCRSVGLALTDAAETVVRERGNASDAHLRVVKPRDFKALLSDIPLCRDIALTGEKAVATLGQIVGFKGIQLGEFVETEFFKSNTHPVGEPMPRCESAPVRIWRMPSSSRAFPRPLEWKADYYRRLLDFVISHP